MASVVNKKAQVFMTLSRQDMAAYDFLCLQADVKDWMERVNGESIQQTDIHELCKDGTFLCKLINKMFPGCIKKYHPAGSMSAKCIENINLFVKVCTKMGMNRGALFDPLDLYERKNMMRVLVALEGMARFVNKKGYPIKWKENDQRNFSMEELKQAEATYSPSEFADMFKKMKKQNKAEAVSAAPAVDVAKAEAMKAKQREAAAAAVSAVQHREPEPEEDPEMVRNRKLRALCDEMDRMLAGTADTTKLHLAVEQQLDPAVDYILREHKFEARKTDSDGNTPLHVAAIVTNHHAAKALLAQDVDVNARNHVGNTALHLAVANGDQKMIDRLIAAGADTSVTNGDGNTPLHIAALSGNERAFEALLAAGANPDARNKDGNTPMHLAAWKGNDGQMTMLIRKGAKPDMANMDGNTPLHFASLRGHKGAVETLMGAGVDVNARNKDGSTALQLATEADEMDIVEMMVTRGGADVKIGKANGWTPLYTAAYNGNRETVDFLCERGANPNEQNDEGWAPLHAACNQGHYKVVKSMVAQWKAKVNIQTKEGTTPLFFAAHTGRPKITEFLLQARADPNCGAKDGWLPLHGAIYNDYDAVVALLLKAGARIDDGVAEIKGYAPIHIAIASEQANEPVVRALIAKGCDINKQTSNGATALHLAVFWGNRKIVKLLLDNGASPKLKNNKNRRPLELAAHYGHKELAEYIAKRMGVACPKITGKAKPKVADMETPSAPPPPE